jgi:ABC-type lipoprotein release transport system permease subunit
VPVHFTAPVAIHVVLLAAALGIAGALLAGALGAWRAARLRPTAALAHVG